MKKKQRRLEQREKKKEVIVEEHRNRWWEYVGLWVISIVFLSTAENLMRFLFLKCADILFYFSPTIVSKPWISLE